MDKKKVSIVLGSDWETGSMDLKQRILSEAEGLFCQYGIKRITMDDIAKHLGMSKKTIYQHFRDKDELVHVLITEMLNRQTCTMDVSCEQAPDAVKEILMVVTHLQELLSKINPMIFYDMQKYHPETWKVFTTHRNEYMQTCITKNIERGIKEGLFRKEINAEIISIMRMDQVDAVFNQVSFAPGKFNLSEVMTEITEHFLYGLCTLEGHKQVEQYKQLHSEQL
ncbi:TetR/AcrR family transcriptional regulator [Desertivirga arenae]|uniref:TetR/AcrR family transcriptional regulator n=1 Tax=Desertivirga arenae TaxID=2810309 RepID=UPI001A9675CD|nr:TetR/AcrR family transcriptional regulator [Pedobacter sp. SYSU D00823]